VYAAKKRWKVQINYGGKKHNLGTFVTKQEAALAYDRHARQCGKDKLTNYGSIEAAEEAAAAAAAQAQAEQTIAQPEKPKPPPASGFYGVYASGKRWVAQIYYDGKQRNLGTVDTKQEAALASDQHVASNLGGQGSASTSVMTPRNHLTINAAEEAAAQAKADYEADNPPQQKPPPSSGFYGVAASGKRWKAQIHYDSKCHIGTFDTKQEAALAYDRKARQCGKDKLMNYESIAAAEEAAVQAQAEFSADALCAGPKQPTPRPPSGFYGVGASGKRWKATIRYDSKSRYLGSFATKQEAALAYEKVARQCGKDKPLNYESIAAAEEAAARAAIATVT
jgi:hypothetical protein